MVLGWSEIISNIVLFNDSINHEFLMKAVRIHVKEFGCFSMLKDG